jgi:hypothetical protein
MLLLLLAEQKPFYRTTESQHTKNIVVSPVAVALPTPAIHAS